MIAVGLRLRLSLCNCWSNVISNVTVENENENKIEIEKPEGRVPLTYRVPIHCYIFTFPLTFHIRFSGECCIEFTR